MLILVINPGSVSTKLALYSSLRSLREENVRHDDAPGYNQLSLMEQLPLRRDGIAGFLARAGVKPQDLSAIAARGGVLKPLEGGTYRVNDQMLQDLKEGKRAVHASNLGGILAQYFAAEASCPAYVVDPVSVDEFTPEARVTGWADLERQSLFHALNSRAIARKASATLGKSYDQARLVVVHLGSGISVSAHLHGRVVDVNNANDEGPFSTERAGSLPVRDVLQSVAESGADLASTITNRAGLFAYLGTKNAQEVEKRIGQGDAQARLVYRAMAHQIAKEIGAMTAVLDGNIDAIVLTGAMAHSELLTHDILQQVGFLALVLRYPGEDEMEALAAGVLRVLKGEEEAKNYA